MGTFRSIEIDNSAASAIRSGHWKAPGASFYDTLLNAFWSPGNKVPEDPKEFAEMLQSGSIKQWPQYLEEAYLVAPVKRIQNGPHGVTPFSRSGCKYPHHVIRGNKLVVSIPGIKAAYTRALQMGVLKGDVKRHLERHIKELGLQVRFKNGSLSWNESHEQKIEDNFAFIENYLTEQTGISLECDVPETFMESVQSSCLSITEDRHWKVLQSEMDDHYKAKGHKSLSNFQKVPITKELTKKYKNDGKLIKWMRDQDPKCDDICWMWIDENDHYVGAITYDSKPDSNGYIWISGFDIAFEYNGYGLARQILDVAVADGVNALEVQYDNEIALNLYKNYGFEISPESQKEVEAGKRQNYDMFLPKKTLPKEIQESFDWIDCFVHDEVFRESVDPSDDPRNSCKTPEELLKWMDCIRYGWLDQDGNIQGTGDEDDEEDFYQQYRLQRPSELIKNKVGVCWDQAELERQWFCGYKVDGKFVPYFVLYLEIQNDQECPSHTCLIYKMPGDSMEVFWFEHSWYDQKGIHSYPDLKTCLKDIVQKHQTMNHDRTHPVFVSIVPMPEKYSEIQTCAEYMSHCHRGPRIDLADIQYDEFFNEAAQVNDDPRIDDPAYIDPAEYYVDPRDQCAHEFPTGYDRPLPFEKLPEHLKDDPVHVWRATYGIELIHKEPTLAELNRIWDNWKKMSPSMQEISDRKSIELFEMDNRMHFEAFVPQYEEDQDDDILESSIDEPYTLDTLPNVMYYASRHKHLVVQNDRVFLTPYLGIASMFICSVMPSIAEYFKQRNGRYPERIGYNSSYVEWNWPGSDLKEPLKRVHITHNIPSLQETLHGTAHGYIHCIDISEIRDQLKLFSSNDPDREVYYDGGLPLKPTQIIEHTIDWEFSYSDENCERHGDGILESKEVRSVIQRRIEMYNAANIGSETSYRGFLQFLEASGEMEEPPEMNPDAGQKSEEPNPSEDVMDEPVEEDPNEGETPLDELEDPQEEETPTEEPEPTEDQVAPEEPVETPPVEEPSAEEPPEMEPQKKTSMPKQTDAAEKDKNGVRRKKLYIAFIEWCKEFNPRNTFGSVFDKDAFSVSYPFVPHEMRYFYRLANPLLCVLSGDLTFFQLSELRKLNAENTKLNEMMIFAATPNDFRVFNVADKKIYRATEEQNQIQLQEELGPTFDEYLQKMVNQGDILNGPIPETAPDQT